MPPPHGNSCQRLAGFLGIAQSNFEKWEDFFPDFPLQPDDATLYKFNYIALTIRVFPLSRGFCNSSTAENLGEGAVLAEGRKITLQHVCFY